MLLSPNISQVIEQVRRNQPNEGFALSQKKSIKLDHLPYSILATNKAFFEFVNNQFVIAQSYSNRNDLNPNGAYLFGEEEQNLLSFAVDSFFDSARRVQNSIIPYLQIAGVNSLPSSMSTLITDIEKYQIKPDIKELLKKYWDVYGHKLKKYRDSCQHHAIISSEGRFIVDTNGNFSIRILLPNNPEESSEIKLKYTDPEVHALPYLKENFFELLSLVHKVLGHLLEAKSSSFVVAQYLTDPISLGPKPQKGFKIQSPMECNSELNDFLKEIYT